MIKLLDLETLHHGLEDEMMSAVLRVIRGNRLVLGPECEAFEHEFARYCGSGYGMGVGNGLDALRLGLLALGIRPGDEVIVPGQTFVATWLAVSSIGAVPVPVDVSPCSGQIDAAAVDAAVTPRTAAIIAVHLFGAVAPMRELSSIAERHGLALLEDAAQAHGASLDGDRVGSLGDFAAFSFYPGKNLGGLGDGGMGVTKHADVAERVRSLRNYGSVAKYHHEEKGVNSRLDEVQAAILRVKLPLLDGWNARRGVLAAQCSEQIADHVSVEFLKIADGVRSAHHILPVRVANRDAVVVRMQAAGVEVGVHYPVTPHRSGAYAGELFPFPLPHSERWAAQELSLPIGPTMTTAEMECVADALAVAVT